MKYYSSYYKKYMYDFYYNTYDSDGKKGLLRVDIAYKLTKTSAEWIRDRYVS